MCVQKEHVQKKLQTQKTNTEPSLVLPHFMGSQLFVSLALLVRNQPHNLRLELISLLRSMDLKVMSTALRIVPERVNYILED